VTIKNSSIPFGAARLQETERSVAVANVSVFKWSELSKTLQVLQPKRGRKDPKILVVYSGPTTLFPTGTAGLGSRSKMYLTNFNYFMAHGVDCNVHDTVFVLSRPVQEAYKSEIEGMRAECDSTSNEIRVLAREDKCYDMESVRLVFAKVNLTRYDYFVYLNCGMLGPKWPSSVTNFSWTSHFTSLISSSVRMSGLSINCDIHPHVQSFLFVLDQVGLEIVKKSSAVYDCGTQNSEMNDTIVKDIVNRYEVGMSKAILDAGYGIASILSTEGLKTLTVTPADLAKGSCKAIDPWFPHTFPRIEGIYPKWQDVVFWKVSRFIPPEILEARIL